MYTSFDETNLDRIVTLLKSQKTEFLSGERLSQILHLSRTAVWKNIKRLQSLGYKIESKPKIGYRLYSSSGLLLPWEITDGLQTDIIGRKIYYFDTVDSTQNFALKLSERPHENGSVAIARRQTKGRGRLNRRWVSPSGGIWLSILLKPNFDLSYTSLFPMATSLALAIAIEKTLKINTQLKWPNDLTINNRKVAGILIDAAIESNKIEYLIIGVGINFKIKAARVSRQIKNQNYDAATLLEKEQGNPVELVQHFLFELEQVYNLVISGKVNEIRKKWIKRSSTIGKNVIATTTTEVLKGKAIGIDETGALLLSKDGKIQRLLAGDVSYKN
jgi:BirA family biotin operon repressor/biotin-[acetyl-CoA-carboxylase] ligase